MGETTMQEQKHEGKTPDPASPRPDVGRLRELAQAIKALDSDEPWILSREMQREWVDEIADFVAACSPDVILALCAALEERERADTPKPVKWLLHEGEHHTDTVYVEQRGQRDGSMRYVVTQQGYVLASDRMWEYEPLPSSRTDEFIARTRHASLADAVAAYRAALAPAAASADTTERDHA